MQEIIITAITVIGKVLIALGVITLIISVAFTFLCLIALQKGSNSHMVIEWEEDEEQLEALRKEQARVQRRKEAMENARKVRESRYRGIDKVIDEEKADE